MAGRLTGKLAVVTGAGSRGPGVGNGKAVAIPFAREGAKVLAVDVVPARSEGTVARIAAEGGIASAFAADVTDRAASDRMVADEEGDAVRLAHAVDPEGAPGGRDDGTGGEGGGGGAADWGCGGAGPAGGVGGVVGRGGGGAAR